VIPAVEPSLKVPLAVNCCELPTFMLAVTGVTATDVRVALVTVREAVPTWPANTAVMVTVPGATPVAIPMLPPALLMVATEEEDDVQVTADVRS